MQVGTPDLRAVWDDPTFQRSFVAGYGVNPEVEPRISQDDMALLELVRQLMPDELAAGLGRRPTAMVMMYPDDHARAAGLSDFRTGGVRGDWVRLGIVLPLASTDALRDPA